MARLTQAHLAELAALQAQTTALLDAFVAVEPPFASTAADMKAALEEVVMLQDLKALRLAARDIRQFLEAVPPHQRKQVFEHVQRASGHPLEDELRKDTALAQAILSRGRIRNNNEYYLLRDYLERIEGDPEEALKRRIQDLLSTYGD